MKRGLLLLSLLILLLMSLSPARPGGKAHTGLSLAREKNPEVFALLEAEGIGLSSFVLDKEDPSFYLTHDWQGRPDPRGALFLDPVSSRRDLDLILIHGHNSRDHTLFSDLVRYEKETFASSHKGFALYLPDGRTKHYQLFCVFLCNDLPSLTLHSGPKGLHPLPGDRIYYEEAPSAGEDLLLLSTCEGTKGQSRLILAASGK